MFLSLVLYLIYWFLFQFGKISLSIDSRWTETAPFQNMTSQIKNNIDVADCSLKFKLVNEVISQQGYQQNKSYVKMMS